MPKTPHTSAPSRDVGLEIASENRAMLGRRERQYWRGIGATEDTAAVARLCLPTFGSDLLPSRSRTRFAAGRTVHALREGALVRILPHRSGDGALREARRLGQVDSGVSDGDQVAPDRSQLAQRQRAGEAAELLDVRAPGRDHDAAVTLGEEVGGAGLDADPAEDRFLGHGHGEPAPRCVVGASQEAPLGGRGEEPVQPPLVLEIRRRDTPSRLAEHYLLVDGAVDCGGAVAGDEDDVARGPEAGAECEGGVVEHADDADDRGRVDRPAMVLVVERDVARDDREAERLARERHALDRLGQLVADLRRLRVPEVEAVRDRGGTGARAGDVAGRLADGAPAAPG